MGGTVIFASKEQEIAKTVWKVLWVKLYLPETYVEVLIPGTYECDFIWKLGPCRCNKVKINSYWVKVGPKSSDRYPYKKAM